MQKDDTPIGYNSDSCKEYRFVKCTEAPCKDTYVEEGNLMSTFYSSENIKKGVTAWIFAGNFNFHCPFLSYGNLDLLDLDLFQKLVLYAWFVTKWKAFIKATSEK